MKTKVLLLALAAVLMMTSCKKEKDEVKPDPYVSFKSDATPRWEFNNIVENSEETSYTYITDTGGSLFSSARYKTGRILSADGSDYEFIEFSGAPAVGMPEDANIRKPSGVTSLYSLEILKIESGKLWMVFKETTTSAERRVVQ